MSNNSESTIKTSTIQEQSPQVPLSELGKLRKEVEKLMRDVLKVVGDEKLQIALIGKLLEARNLLDGREQESTNRAQD